LKESLRALNPLVRSMDSIVALHLTKLACFCHFGRHIIEDGEKRHLHGIFWQEAAIRGREMTRLKSIMQSAPAPCLPLHQGRSGVLPRAPFCHTQRYQYVWSLVETMSTLVQQNQLPKYLVYHALSCLC
jgi:hypothetical protein